MKKILVTICSVGLLLALIVPAFAVGSKPFSCARTSTGTCPKNGTGYVDENGDGICDRSNSSCAFTDEDGDGICDRSNSNCVFTDEDGDGICDNCGMQHVRKGCGRQADSSPAAAQGRHGSGHGRGRHHA